MSALLLRVAWEPVAMALFLWLFAGWALYVAVKGNIGPPQRSAFQRRSSFDELLWAVSPKLYAGFNRVILFIGGLALAAGGVAVLVYKW